MADPLTGRPVLSVEVTSATAGTPGRRRRSRQVSVLLVGAAATALLPLAGCGEDAQQTEAKIFPSVAACEAEFSKEQCAQAFEASRQLHIQNAPKFQSQAECEAAMGPGACTVISGPTPTGGVGSFFIPALAGFMLAQAITPRGGFGGAPLIGELDIDLPGGRKYRPRPIYVDRSGYLRSGANQIAQLPGTRESFTKSRSGTTVNTVTTRSGQVGRATTSRGGFGSTASSRSGGS